MSKKRKKDKLLLNLAQGEKYKHRVAMVNEEGGWNQHEPNSGMARMFVIMLLVHVIVIGGIIIYDFINGEDAPATRLVQEYSAVGSNTLPAADVSAALEKEMPIEDYATYEWRSGDSLPRVAEKLGVSEEVLIKLNMLDQGVQIDQNTILRYPRRPLVKAVGINVAGANGEAVKVAAVADTTPSQPPMDLAAPGETFTLQPTIMDRLTPAPDLAPGQVIQQSPPEAARTPDITPAAPSVVAKVDPPKPAAKPAAVTQPQVERPVPKAVPLSPTAALAVKSEKPAPRKIEQAPPAAKAASAPKAAVASHLVKPGETLYGIAGKYGISVASLQAANKVTKPEALRDGMKLVIPAK